MCKLTLVLSLVLPLFARAGDGGTASINGYTPNTQNVSIARWPEDLQRDSDQLRYSVVFATGNLTCKGVIISKHDFVTASHCREAFAKSFSYFSHIPTFFEDSPNMRANVVSVQGPTYSDKPCDFANSDTDIIRFKLCELSKISPRDLNLIHTTANFSENQILAVGSNLNEGDEVEVQIQSWYRADLKYAIAPMGHPEWRVPAWRFASEYRRPVNRKMYFHQLSNEFGSALFLTCDNDDPYDQCGGIPGDSGSPIVRKTASGFELVGVVTGISHDPLKVTSEVDAEKWYKLRNNGISLLNFSDTYPYAVVLAPYRLIGP